MKKKILSALMVAVLLAPTCSMKASANVAYDFLRTTTGVVVGVGLGTPIAGIRGLTKGWVDGTNYTAEGLGDANGIPHNVIGFATGGVVGGAAGAVSGVLMGAYDGIKQGIDEPWSPESYSAGGTDLLDYDPFAWE